MLPWGHLSPTAATSCPCFTMAKALWDRLLAPGTRNPGNKAENVYTRFVIKMQRLSSSGENPCVSVDLLRAHAPSLSADWVRELCWAMAELSLPPSTHPDTPARAPSASAAAGARAGATFWLFCQRWILASPASRSAHHALSAQSRFGCCKVPQLCQMLPALSLSHLL